MATEPVGGRARLSFKAIGRALAHRNYRLFFAGQGTSLIGTWMTRVAAGVFVKMLRPDVNWLLGVVAFAGLFPAFLLGPIAGVLVDRWDRRRCLVVTQVLSLIQSAWMAWIAFSALSVDAKIWQIIALSVCQGLINAFDMPARQVFLAEIVERKEDLANAIALNSSMFNGARLVGPAIAGALIAEVGVGWCFVVDSASYVAVIAALLAMRIERRAAVATHVPLLRGLTDGLSYCMSFKPIRALLLLSATLSFVAIPYSVLLPTFAIDVLHGNEATLGFLTSANGLGALIGALYLASRSSVLGLGRLIGAATIVFGIGLLGFAFSHSLLLSLVALLIGGVGMMIQMAAANTILQTIADQDKRGRVMSLYSMAVLGVSPFGSLLGGFLADWTSPAATVALGGFGCLISAALFFRALPELRAHIRPVYRRMGILPMPDPTDPSLEVPTPS